MVFCESNQNRRPVKTQKPHGTKNRCEMGLLLYRDKKANEHPPPIVVLGEGVIRGSRSASGKKTTCIGMRMGGEGENRGIIRQRVRQVYMFTSVGVLVLGIFYSRQPLISLILAKCLFASPDPRRGRSRRET